MSNAHSCASGYVGFLSDTHGSVSAVSAALALLDEAELLVHVGDVLYHGPRNPLPEEYAPNEAARLLQASRAPLWVARGNCDADVDTLVLDAPFAPSLLLWWRGLRILVEHGESFGAFRRRAIRSGVHLAVFGHTHVASVVREEGVIFLNPGSAALPKGRDPASVARVYPDSLVLMTLSGEILHREAPIG